MTNDLERELSQVMRERTAAITAPPPMSHPNRRPEPRGRPRRTVVAVAATALVLLGGGALAAVLSSFSITPVSDRYAIASGETEQGPWTLTLYQARITGTSAPEGDEATWWCLDLDGPGVDDSETPETQIANICNLPSDVGTETFGPTAGFPGFRGEEALVYGQVSTEVARLEVKHENGDVGDIPLILPPEETDLQVQYFVAFVPEGQTVELVALDDSGQTLGTRGHPA